MSWDDLLEEMARKMDGAMRLHVKTNESETIMDEEGREEGDGNLGSFFNCNNTWLLCLMSLICLM